jgi:hypothetical protein
MMLSESSLHCLMPDIISSCTRFSDVEPSPLFVSVLFLTFLVQIYTVALFGSFLILVKYQGLVL